VPGLLTSGRIRSTYSFLLSPSVPHALPVYLLSTLIVPSSWTQAAYALAEAMKGDGSAVFNSVIPRPGDLARSAVSCNDNAPFKTPPPEVVVDELLGVFHNVSRFGFTVVTTEPDMGCQYWPVTPPERFQGPWNHTLSNPILVLSNTVCPPLLGFRYDANHSGRLTP
jgi:hypothetical protein